MFFCVPFYCTVKKLVLTRGRCYIKGPQSLHSDEFVKCHQLLLKVSPTLILLQIYIYSEHEWCVCVSLCVSAQGNSLQDFLLYGPQ